MIFVDTSVLYATADTDADEHDRGKALLRAAMDAEEALVSHNYVLVETVALLHHRLGRRVAVRLQAQATGFLEIDWVDAALHASVAAAFARRPGTRVSFVDEVSFAVMRTRKITRALAFDDDFRREGFTLYDGK